MRASFWSLVCLCLGLNLCLDVNTMSAAEVKTWSDAETGWTIHQATAGNTVALVAPDAGCNLYSIKIDGREILKTPKSLKDLRGFMYGNPICYPTPNRVAKAEFTFEGQTFKFPANNGTNFLHGLVHSAPWEHVSSQVDGAKETVTMNFQLVFKEGTEWYQLFPLAHTLKMTIVVGAGSVGFHYTVDNTAGTKAVPFGLCFHPWFLYLGERRHTYLHVPASHVFEVSDPTPTGLIPTGKLLELKGNPHDLSEPRSLQDFVIDDVFFGMTPDKTAVIDYRDVKLKLSLPATADFTHMVVYTPNEPWFCVENQTCSTDAHNLHARGLTKEAHLLIVPPGKTHTGTAEFKIAKY